MTKKKESPGAGDILNGFLGSVILSFAFSVYGQRMVGEISNQLNSCTCVDRSLNTHGTVVQIIRRHAAEITTAVVVASLFSMYSTASVGRLLGLLPSLTRAIIPHCVTVALALPIATLLEGQDL